MGRRSVASMLTLLRFIVSVLVRRFRSRAVLELENLALRHQLHVLRRPWFLKTSSARTGRKEWRGRLAALLMSSQCQRSHRPDKV
jgi:hypothetical protein